VSGQPVVCGDRHELGRQLAGARARGEAIAFVPTMGALHVGHIALVERATALAPNVVVSIFVNPTQFDIAADLEAYPRTLEDDLARLAAAHDPVRGRLLVYVPSIEDVYPDGPQRSLHVPDVTEHLCGATRPGHFDGVATVVDALVRAVGPTVLVMGRKDHQQLVVVRRLIAMQGHAVAVDAAPTVRGPDGIAVSSRNRLLDDAAHVLARRIPRALASGVASIRAARAAGIPVAALDVRDAAAFVLDADGLTLDYLSLVDPERIVPLEGVLAGDAQALLAVAVHVRSGASTVRLIDNVLLGDAEDEQRLIDALAGPGDPGFRGLEG
jgi:pantoate--beta-alanine ligase